MQEVTKEEMLIYLRDLYLVRHGFSFDEWDKRCDSEICNALYDSIRTLIAAHAEPRRVTREQVEKWADQAYLCTEQEAPEVIRMILADLGIGVEEGK